MRKYTREDVETHRIGYSHQSAPAVNVKQYHYTSPDTVIRKFGCSEETAEKALQYVIDSAREMFWDMDAPQMVEESFGKYAEFHSEGRCGGWLVVTSLAPIDEWDAVKLAKWRSFAARVRREVNYLTSDEYALDMIEANGWADPEEQDENEVTTRYANALSDLHA